MVVLAAILVFGLVVLFHEFGHFIVAKMCGVKVHEFAFGMGTKLFSIQGKETEYTLRLFPLGGFIRMEGEDESSNDPRSFDKKTIFQRISIIFAGPFMNFVLAILLFIIIFLYIGIPSTTIDTVQENMPAYTSGIKSGDKIVQINGIKVDEWKDVISQISSSEKYVDLKVERDNKLVDYKVEVKNQDGRKIIGITTKNERNVLGVFTYSIERCVSILNEMINFLVQAITGKASSDDIAGPVGIIGIVGQVAKTGIINVLNLAAIISLNLGLFNLLPIPALDGSRILFLIVEFLRGKKISAEKEGTIHFVGLVALMILMLFVTYKDILKLVN